MKITGFVFAYMFAMACVVASPTVLALESQCIIPELGLPLAGEKAVDCGVVLQGDPAQRDRVVACARKAIVKGRPVRFGVAYNGTDAFGCDVAIRDQQGAYWKVEFEWDLSLPEDERLKAFVGRCPTIDLDWVDPSGSGAFGPKVCTADEEAFKRARIRRP